MKQLLACACLLASAGVSVGQEDTTRKTVDTALKDSTYRMTLSDTLTLHAQEPAQEKRQKVYRIKPAIDLPIIAASTAWSLYGFKEIYNKPSSSDAEILALNKANINGFDRWAAGKYSPAAEKASDVLFYGSMPLPLLLMLDKKIRQDAGNVLLVYWETMGVTGVFYTGSAYLTDRYRPFVYNTSVPMDERKSGNSKNSFLAGHPALVASSTFFIAKVYADYHPESKFRWVFYTAASGATLATAYLRHRAGKHFPSDLIAGTAMGTAAGILVPHFHKNKLFKKHPNLSVTPFTGESHGLRMVYRL